MDHRQDVIGLNTTLALITRDEHRTEISIIPYAPAKGTQRRRPRRRLRDVAESKDVAALKAEKDKATGVYYRLTVEHVTKVLNELKRVVPDCDAAQGLRAGGFRVVSGLERHGGLRHLPEPRKPSAASARDWRSGWRNSDNSLSC